MKGEQLKSLRKELGLSQVESAIQVHVAPRTWYRWEAGERRIPESVVELYCTKNSVKYPQVKD